MSYPTSTATITYGANYIFHQFNNSGTITFPVNIITPILLVGGGGGPGNYNSTIFNNITNTGGGGGAGQMIYGNVKFSAGTHSVTIGNGGALSTNGGNSSVIGPDIKVIALGGNAGSNAAFLNDNGTTNPRQGGYGGNTFASSDTFGFVDYVSFANKGGPYSEYGYSVGINQKRQYQGGGGAGAGGDAVAWTGTSITPGGIGAIWPLNGTMYANGGSAGNVSVNGNTSTNPGSGAGSFSYNNPNPVITGTKGIIIVAIPYSKPILYYNGLSALPPIKSITSYLGNTDPGEWVICDGVPRTITDNRYNDLIILGIGTKNTTTNTYTPPDYGNTFTTPTGVRWIMKL